MLSVFVKFTPRACHHYTNLTVVCACVTYEREVTGSYSTSENKVAFLCNAAPAWMLQKYSSLSLMATAVANTEVSFCKRAARQN